jgi:hypothetical protein
MTILLKMQFIMREYDSDIYGPLLWRSFLSEFRQFVNFYKNFLAEFDARFLHVPPSVQKGREVMS